MTTKVTILCGVSTDSQASEDKASIPSQIETCREFIRRNGGREVGLFIMDGFSRFGYFNLDDARREIPPFDECLKQVERGEVDGILLDNLDRLGDLGMMLLTDHNGRNRTRPVHK